MNFILGMISVPSAFSHMKWWRYQLLQMPLYQCMFTINIVMRDQLAVVMYGLDIFVFYLWIGKLQIVWALFLRNWWVKQNCILMLNAFAYYFLSGYRASVFYYWEVTCPFRKWLGYNIFVGQFIFQAWWFWFFSIPICGKMKSSLIMFQRLWCWSYSVLCTCGL